jgi:glycosyltransferase involved in cell wall biosynthesis
MPPMEHVWHFVDRSCRPEAVAEAGLLAAPERLVSVRSASSLKSELFSRWKADRSPRRILQCWSISAAQAVLRAAGDLLPADSFGVAVRLTSGSDVAGVGDIAATAKETGLLFVADGPVLLEQVRQAHPTAHVACVNPPGIAHQHLSQRRQLREQAGLAQQDFILAAPATSSRTSGHLYAMWSTAILVVAEFPVKLVIQAAGASKALTRFAEDSGFSDRLVATELSSPQLAALADAVLLLDEDELPAFHAAQALSAQTPIVATDTPSARAVLGEEGLFVPPRQPRRIAQLLLRLIEEPAFAAEMKQKMARIAADFRADDVLRQWRKIHEDLDGA